MRDDTKDALMAQMTWRIHSPLSIVDLKGGQKRRNQSEMKGKTQQWSLNGTQLSKKIEQTFLFVFLCVTIKQMEPK